MEYRDRGSGVRCQERFKERYENVIKPAIESAPLMGIPLRAYRVDNSKTGDSILADIVDGIAHSRLVLADVSVIDEGRYTQTPIRNGNVMYEVGIGLACRNPSEVLLIRDDTKPFLFDVSTIPHMHVDFSDHDAAINSLRGALSDCLTEAKLLDDARVKLAVQTLTQHELQILKTLVQLEPNQCRNLAHRGLGQISIPVQRSVDGLIGKGCIKSVAVNDETGTVFYALNAFGYAIAKAAEGTLAKVQLEPKKEASDETQNHAP